MRAVAVEHVALTAAAFAKMVGVENAVTKNWVGAVNVRLDAITGMLFLGMITRERCALATEPAPKARAQRPASAKMVGQVPHATPLRTVSRHVLLVVSAALRAQVMGVAWRVLARVYATSITKAMIAVIPSIIWTPRQVVQPLEISCAPHMASVSGRVVPAARSATALTVGMALTVRS